MVEPSGAGTFVPFGTNHGCNQFLNWLPQHAAGMLHLID